MSFHYCADTVGCAKVGCATAGCATVWCATVGCAKVGCATTNFFYRWTQDATRNAEEYYRPT